MRLAGALAIALLAASGAPGAPLRFAPERDYGPFVFVGDEGAVEGLSIDLLRLVQQHTGLRIEMLPAQPLQRNLEQARRGEVDLLSSLRPTPERAAFLRFSQPYVSVPALLVGRAGGVRTANAGDPLAALAGRPVAVGAGYAVESVVRRTHPHVDWRAVPDDVQALHGVHEGRFDAAVVDAASASFVIRRHGLAGLASRGDVGFRYELSFAVPAQRADLVERLNEGIRSIPVAEREVVIERWLAPLKTPTFGRRSLQAAAWGGALFGAGALTALVLWWRRPARRPR
jgi:ABC-type amino acid transport substrate-binding protein